MFATVMSDSRERTLPPGPCRIEQQQQHHRRRERRRVLGSMSYLAEVPVVDGLINVERLVFVFLQREDPPAQCLHLRAFCGGQIPWGIMWGGARHCRLDQRLYPDSATVVDERPPAIHDASLSALILRLDSELQQLSACAQPRRLQKLRLPRLWAAFDSRIAGRVAGDGPEFQSRLRQTGGSASETLHHSQRRHRGLILFPLPWVSHLWQQFTAVFADVSRFPRYQVFLGRNPSSVLQGYYGAAQFDFSPDMRGRSTSTRGREKYRRRGIACPDRCCDG
jgi:hypothetical protein